MAVYPDIAGDLVVWQNATGQDADDIYLLDLAAGKTLQVTDDDALQFLPRVSGSRVVWMDNRSGDWDTLPLHPPERNSVYLRHGAERPERHRPG